MGKVEDLHVGHRRCANETCVSLWERKSPRLVKPPLRKYCSERCARAKHARSYEQRQRAKKKSKRLTDAGVKVDGGPLYQKAVELGVADALVSGVMKTNEAAGALQCSLSMVYRIKGMREAEVAREEIAETWQPEPWAIEILNDFAEFRSHFFEVSPGKAFVTKDFHQKWIDSIEEAMATGGAQIILSPPRHGKTELLIHFCVWRIIRDPDIHIMWVGKNENIARNSVKAVTDHLANNRLLRDTYLPPGRSWKPESRTGRSWSKSEFSVANQSVVGIKSPTMIALGRGGSAILSRDTDLIIADDIEDHGSVNQESSRAETRSWWTTQVGSRVEAHTAQVVIGSRQHPEDLYHHLLDNPLWESITESAHDEKCDKDPGRLAIHKSCMLWPEKNSYEWLMNRKLAASTTGGLATFEMVYLNKTANIANLIFSRDSIEACYNHDRPIGHVPAGVYLIAGLDPATSGFQASFLWGMEFRGDHPKQYMIDVNNEAGGGMAGASRIIKDWYEKYHVAHWVIEENGWQKAIRMDRDLREWCNNHGVRLDGHETYKNKWDPELGVTKMADLFTNHQFDLPYLGADAQQKTDLLTRQLIGFSRDGRRTNARRGYQSDLVMAMWFPQKHWRRETRKVLTGVTVDYDPVYPGLEPLEVTL